MINLVYDTRETTPAKALINVIRGGSGGITPGDGVTFFGPMNYWKGGSGISGDKDAEVLGESGLAVLSGVGGSSLSCFSASGSGAEILSHGEMRRNDFTRMMLSGGNNVAGGGNESCADIDYYLKSAWIEVPGAAPDSGEFYGFDQAAPLEPMLVLIGGNFGGDVVPMVVKKEGVQNLVNRDAKNVVLRGGHCSTVRTVSAAFGGFVTGGEDGRICFWDRTCGDGNDQSRQGGGDEGSEHNKQNRRKGKHKGRGRERERRKGSSRPY